MPDLIIRGGSVVTTGGVSKIDIAIEDGVIAALQPELPGSANEIDAAGLTILPGLIDVHVHFNEPGRTEWEGAATGSRALAATGGTVFFDMPLNSSPCTVNATAFDEKRVALEKSSLTDFALWGGLIPGNTANLEDLAARGVIGYKAFMSDSGLPEFPCSDEETLFEGMRIAARHGLPVAVHAESESLTSQLTRELLSSGRCSIRDYLRSRPIQAEVDAINLAASLAEQAGAKLHIVHVSSGQGVAAALEARGRGVDVSIETCPHYLFFTGDDMERLGAVAKCAPPLRGAEERDALWSRVLDGVDIVGSDHSPAPASMKQGDNFFRIWGGIAGVQATLPVMLDQGYHARKLPLERIANLLATRAATRFRIAGKGKIEVGRSADLALVDLGDSSPMRTDDLLQRHPASPYAGYAFRGRVRRTLLRGQTIFLDGRIVTGNPGRLIKPELESR